MSVQPINVDLRHGCVEIYDGDFAPQKPVGPRGYGSYHDESCTSEVVPFFVDGKKKWSTAQDPLRGRKTQRKVKRVIR